MFVMKHRLKYYSDAFKARSSDELSLARGEYIELLEKDDDFGDGWYLGRHFESKTNGLFPQGTERIWQKKLTLTFIQCIPR